MVEIDVPCAGREGRARDGRGNEWISSHPSRNCRSCGLALGKQGQQQYCRKKQRSVVVLEKEQSLEYWYGLRVEQVRPHRHLQGVDAGRDQQSHGASGDHAWLVPEKSSGSGGTCHVNPRVWPLGRRGRSIRLPNRRGAIFAARKIRQAANSTVTLSGILSAAAATEGAAGHVWQRAATASSGNSGGRWSAGW